MVIVGVREFKNRASELLRAAEAGREVTITRHARPVARLVPVTRAKPESEEAMLDRLAAQGIIERGGSRPFANKKWRPIKGKGKPLSQIIIEEREEGY